MYFFGINVKIINVGRVITLDNKDEKEIKKVTRKKKENNENEIKEKLKTEENKRVTIPRLFLCGQILLFGKLGK